MQLLCNEDALFQEFTGGVEHIIEKLSGHAKAGDINELKNLIKNFKLKTEDFYREDRKLNIGVVGQVKAGKSSFLNTLLFDGKEILPKASTPKTATLTKMEYSEKNTIQIEYYSLDEWEVLKDNAAIDSDDEIYTSARELVEMVRNNGIDPEPYLQKGQESFDFATYDDLIKHLNDYVGEDGKFTPIVKSVTLYLSKDEFRGLSIVDTPGLNDPIASRTIRTKEFMELCDVVFFLSQSGQFLDKSDWILLSSQLPQKGVKKLVLVASKYDSGIRDILRKSDDDDIFGEDENTADNIPKACKICHKKLRKRAKAKVEEFIAYLRTQGSSPELIEVIGECRNPIMVSSLARNMIGKDIADFSPEELNLYSALQQFSTNMEEDLQLLGNFSEVHELFDGVAREKEKILEQKARGFVPAAREELKGLLGAFFEKANKRAQVLETNDRAQLVEQKKAAENQINGVKSDIAVIFGELASKLETEKQSALREIREFSKEHLSISEHAGTKTHHESYRVSDAKLWNPFSWFSSHIEHYTYQEHYSYCLAADAIENLNKFSMEAANKVEEVFSEALQLKELKRKLSNVVVNNFDTGSENFDFSLFKITVEENVNKIEFPAFHIDISCAMGAIAGKFSGELTSAQEKTALAQALSNAVSRIYGEIMNRLESTVKQYKDDLANIGHDMEERLLTNISAEFDALIEQCASKEKEISAYKEYAQLLQGELSRL